MRDVARPIANARSLRALQGNALGIVAMMASMAAFIVNDAFVKAVGERLPLGEIMLLRGGFAILFVGVLAWRFGAFRPPRAVVNWPVALRATGEVGGTVTFLSGLMLLPFADANAILQTTPLATTAAAALFLGEAVGWRRWSAAAVGLVGVLLIIKPGTTAFNIGSLFVVLSVLFVVLRDLATRQIDPAIPSLMVTVISALSVSSAGLVVFLLEGNVSPAPTDVALLAAAAVFLVLGYFFITVAMRAGEISVIAPFRYSIVIYALLIGYVVWGTVPDGLAMIGLAVVSLAGLYTFYRERSRGADRVRAPEPAA